MSAIAEADAIRQLARTYQYDRYLAALLAPRAHREALIILAAFAGELQRIPLIVNEPMMAAVRLQWWRDTLDAGARKDGGGARSGHVLADALSDTARCHALPFGLLQGMIDAAEAELDAAPFNEGAEVRQLLVKFEAAGFELAGRVLAAGSADRELWAHAGAAFGYARLAAETGWRHRTGAQTFATRDLDAAGAMTAAEMAANFKAAAQSDLAVVRNAYPRLDRATRCALLPLATVTPLLRAVVMAEHQANAGPVAISPFARARAVLWAYWRQQI